MRANRGKKRKTYSFTLTLSRWDAVHLIEMLCFKMNDKTDDPVSIHDPIKVTFNSSEANLIKKVEVK